MAKINCLKEINNIGGQDLQYYKDIKSVLTGWVETARKDKKNKNGLFSPFLLGELLFWQGKGRGNKACLPKVDNLIRVINHFNAVTTLKWDDKNIYIFVIPFDDSNGIQQVRCYITTDSSKFESAKERAKPSPKTDKQRLVSRLESLLTDFQEIINKGDQALIYKMIDHYKD